MKHLKYIIIVVTVAILLVACDRDDLPNGREKLILASQMVTQETKSTTDNTWNGGEQVFVSLDNEPARIFTIDPGGMLTPANDIWWRSSTQTVSARAWYPDPALWSFPADQSGGLQAADFIFAPTISGIKYNNYMANPLSFYHLPVKVVVNLTPGTDISSVSTATVSFYGYLSGTVDTDNGVIIGSDTDKGWITPFRTAATDTYSALLISCDMTGVRFIKVTLDGYDYYYTPAAGEAVLEQGNTYTYNIDVSKTRLTVTAVNNGATWGDSGSEDTVTADPI